MAKKPVKEVPFFPDHFLKEAIMAAVLLVIVFAIGRYVAVPLDRQANPTDTTFVPRPEWYFLFLFQLLTYFKGSTEIIGTFVIPTLFILLFILLPFFDRNPAKRPSERPVAIGTGSVIVVAVIILTILGARITPLSLSITLLGNPQHGKQIYDQQNCESCHKINGRGGDVGPDLSHEGSGGRTPDYLFKHFKNPQALVPDSPMPAVDLPDKDIRDLTSYMITLR